MKSLKVITVGEVSIGKTCLIRALIGEPFNENEGTTITCDFSLKRVDYEGDTIEFKYWDTAGQEKFAKLNQHYIRDADVVLLVCSPKNFETIEKYVNFINESIDDQNYELFIVFSKCDIYKMTESEKDAIFEKCKAFNPRGIYETSAKAMYNIENLESDIASCTMHRSQTQHTVSSDKKKCC
ncbi:small GTP-binding protein, putative [Trichomonas vaginalis G3]|uniref:Small GTP-binding protein, putative n=1 Tax=Trichomonas vaginalis (strain ATCC PRA-98 / G3) TaxID=412133 RepID=A2DKL4_TRIV3|nr:GTPase protein [Trichomonas vaginalis G3]EAY18997.1 small GTP-binding protein, putative [Trichomonas vaginalis G3]KAI5521210.1 GTPase protein [Trichomonas vaginalis G3]|eukprot:XP_001579983.1 small GTP-binding protein [Trichomonas vaginalis G3]